MVQIWCNVLLLLLSALVLAACGDERRPGSGRPRDERTIVTEKGSDTMILLANKWAELFGEKHPNIEVQVTGGGSGTGISSLINGTTDIANASRSIKEKERQLMKQRYGTEAVEIPVAMDGIAVYVNASNPIKQITLEQLKGVYSGQIRNWTEMGGPDRPIVLYGRENSSGTYEFFRDHVLDKGDFAAAVQTLPGTAAVVNAVSKDETGIGYGGQTFTGGVKAIGIVGADGSAVEPTEDNIRSGAYPLSRNLYFYLRQQPSGPIKEYVDWVLGAEGQAVVKDAGYYPLR